MLLRQVGNLIMVKPFFGKVACCKPKIGHLHENRFLYPNKVENLKCINIMLVPGDINYATGQPIKGGFFLNLAEGDGNFGSI